MLPEQKGSLEIEEERKKVLCGEDRKDGNTKKGARPLDAMAQWDEVANDRSNIC